MVIVCKHKYLIFGTFTVIFQIFKCFNNSLKLTIIDFVLNFGRNYLFKEKNYRIVLIQVIKNQLIKNSNICIAKNIFLNINIIF